jgi:hypothetical protein
MSYEVTILSVYVPLSPPFQLLNNFTKFREAWYIRCVTEGSPDAVIFSFLQFFADWY